jgi:hypothetical protein
LHDCISTWLGIRLEQFSPVIIDAKYGVCKRRKEKMAKKRRFLPVFAGQDTKTGMF